MDALADAKHSLETSLRSWASDGQTLIKSATALGVDTEGVIAGLTGRTRSTPVTAATTPKRARRRRTTTASAARRTTASNGARKVTDGQILAFLQEHPGASSARLAEQFSMSRTGIDNRMKALLGTAGVSKEGAGWYAASLTPAAA